jgi:hypothetical protein
MIYLEILTTFNIPIYIYDGFAMEHGGTESISVIKGDIISGYYTKSTSYSRPYFRIEKLERHHMTLFSDDIIYTESKINKNSSLSIDFIGANNGIFRDITKQKERELKINNLLNQN